MISVSVDAKNFLSFMKDLKQKTSNMAPAFRDAGEYLKKETDLQFKNETDPDGQSWKPLKPSTIARKKTPFKLRETFEMYNSVYYVADNKRFEFGIKDPKYIHHHYGTRNMPARVLIGITNERRGQINKFVIAQIRRVKSLRGTGRKR